MAIPARQRPTPLDQLTAEIAALKHALDGVLRTTMPMILAIGTKLRQARALVPTGQWGVWLRQHFSWSDQMALNFMYAADRLGGKGLDELPIEPSALYLLTAPGTPEPVLNHAIERAQTGTTITYSVAQDLLRHRGAGGPRSRPRQTLPAPTRPGPQGQELPVDDAHLAEALRQDRPRAGREAPPRLLGVNFLRDEAVWLRDLCRRLLEADHNANFLHTADSPLRGEDAARLEILAAHLDELLAQP
jgi:hypothetical protein